MMTGKKVLGMKFKNGLQRFGYTLTHYKLVIFLVWAILLSLVLSVIMWFNSGHVDEAAQTNRSAATLTTAKSLSNIYSPEQLLYTDEAGQSSSVLDFRPINAKIIQALQTWKTGSISQEKVSAAKLVKIVQTKNTFVIGFGDGVAGSVVNKLFGDHFGIPNNAQIYSVQVPKAAQPEVVRFIDDKKKIVYTCQINKADKSLHKLNVPNDTAAIKIKYGAEHLLVYFIQPIQLDTYTYLQGVNKIDTYVTALFANSKETPRAFHVGDELGYNDGANKQLKVNPSDGTYKFDSYNTNTKLNSFGARLQSAYSWLKVIRQLPDNLYYFESHDEGKTINFRLYANGLPIMNDKGYGSITVQQKATKHVQLAFSQYILQVPLPSTDKRVVTLQPTAVILAELKQAGYSKKAITNLRFCYTWESDKNYTDAVTLRPEWYVELAKDDQWYAVDELVQQGGN
ncbi:MAG: YycH family regulatory protein [Lactobacillaceae bacterium]|nr:YycH family regulatory protein [Lactobacillaceae bacterium]